ncbi:MAG: ABC transporter ATP-binding protein [Dehalococcoidia bacterium]
MDDAGSPTLEALDVTYGFPGRPIFLQPTRLSIRSGQCWGVIGPNGAGKSTLLRLLAGLLPPASGDVRLAGRSLANMSSGCRARQIAFLPQHLPTDLPSTAREIVLMGRFPHRGFGLFESAADFEIADRALAATEVTSFADRPLATLSGGEAQRVHIAAAIAQQPRVLLLDEPTAGLDLCHELAVFSRLRKLAEEDGLAVVVVTHDINLAARFCGRVLLLDDGRPVAAGPPAEVISTEVLEPVYGVELVAARAGRSGDSWIVPLGPRHPASDDPQSQRDRE